MKIGNKVYKSLRDSRSVKRVTKTRVILDNDTYWTLRGYSVKQPGFYTSITPMTAELRAAALRLRAIRQLSKFDWAGLNDGQLARVLEIITEEQATAEATVTPLR